jgi:hypothetical protein
LPKSPKFALLRDNSGTWQAALMRGQDRCVITGMHAIALSPGHPRRCAPFSAGARDLPPASAGEGWLIFALPRRTGRAPIRRDRRHERYPMCDDIHTTLAELRDKDIEVARCFRSGLEAIGHNPSSRRRRIPIHELRHPSPLQP